MRTALNVVYYGFYVLTLAIVVLMGYVIDLSNVALDPQSQTGQIVQYIVIAYILVSIPCALYGFKRLMIRIKTIEDESLRTRMYYRWAMVRMVVIGIGAIVAVAAFYILCSYRSMLWCAAMVLVALYFCKPTDKKAYIEMNDIKDETI